MRPGSFDGRLTRRAFTLSAAAALVAPGPALTEQGESARVRALLADWIDLRRQCLGASVSVVEAHGASVLAHGVRGLHDQASIDPGTVFGIASLTKVFTGLLLADAVLRREFSLDDPVRTHLPSGVSLPKYAGREMAIIDLATHTSGLPQEITDHVAAAQRTTGDPLAPLFEFVASFTFSREIGSRWSYSNVGYALLGAALEHRTGEQYGDLVRTRIARPLGMQSTSVTRVPSPGANRAAPHLDVSAAAPEWNKPWSLAAGGLQSSAQDLGLFLEAAIGLRRTPLRAAFAAMLETTRPAPFLEGDQGLGWGIDRSQGEPRVFFGGRAPGFTSAMMFVPGERRGVAALGNSSLMIESLAREILRPGSTQAQEPVARPVASDPMLDRLTGRYSLTEPHRDANLAAGEVFEIVRTEAGIAVSMPRYPQVALKRLDGNRFEIDGFPVTYEFDTSDGPAAWFQVTINGRPVRAERILR
jgi:CubicO group peptidase (beta-lactamase class C family)